MKDNNTANKLTILRVVMIPAFLLVLYLDVPTPTTGLWPFSPRQCDGHSGRLHRPALQPDHDFGKFMDPLADSAW